MNENEILLNVEVPWQVSPSEANLSLAYDEENNKVDVELNGNLGPISEEGNDSLRIRLNFSGVGWFRLSPSVGDRDISDSFSYKLDKIDGRKKENEEIIGWMKRVRSIWAEKYICPDPQFYVVQNSRWVEESGAGKWDCKHYFIFSDRTYFEILANSFE